MNIDQHDLSRICGKPALFYLLAVDAWIKFNTYRYTDYKEQVIGLLAGVDVERACPGQCRA